MDNSLTEKSNRSFWMDSMNSRLRPSQVPFWQKLREVGTELWLDTGDMDEAEKNWSAEMTALTTNNTLVNKEIQKGIYDDFIAEAKGLVKDLPLRQQIMEIALF